jgi:hypothetical protein
VIDGVSVVARVPDAVQVEEQTLQVWEEGFEARTEEGEEKGDYEREAGEAGYGASSILLRREQLFPPTPCLIWLIL